MYATSGKQLAPRFSGILVWDRAGPPTKLLVYYALLAHSCRNRGSKNGYTASQKATREGLTRANGAHLKIPLGTFMQAPMADGGTLLCILLDSGLGSCWLSLPFTVRVPT